MLYYKHISKWTPLEQKISRYTREFCRQGIPINTEKLQEGTNELTNELFNIDNIIPWVKDGEKPLSRKCMALQCRKVGIPVPKSMAKDSDAFSN